MAVDAVSTSTTTTVSNPWANAGSSSTDDTDASLNYDNFLQLLIAQMTNQDPTDPMDASEQVAQLATFSQVEQTIQTNTHLKSMLQAEALTRAGDLIGKAVTTADGETSGIVKEVEVFADGVVLITEDGDELLLEVGMSFSDEVAVTDPDPDTDTDTDTDTDSDTTTDS